MPRTALLLTIALAACAAATPEAPVFIDDFVTRSTPALCEPIPSPAPPGTAVRDLAAIDDSTFLVLFDEIGEVAVIGADLAPRHRIAFETGEAGGIRTPASAALVGDSLIYIADQTRMRLVAFDLRGGEREAIELDFAPQGLRPDGDRILITPFVVGNHPRALLHALEDGRLRALPVPTSRYRDPLVNVLANTATVATYPDGRIVVTQTMVVPFAQILAPGSPAPERIPLPLPDGVRDRYGWLPTGRFTEADAGEVLFAAIASSPDTRTGDLIYLTKTGREIEAGGEKALIRVDSRLRFLRSYLLDVNATKVAYLAGQGISIVTTTEDEWYSCETP